jgi:DNA replication and repair protein RecF
MALLSLQITNLRNISHCQIEPGPGLNVFFGPNGSGKTTLLEAIHILSCTRSFRGARSGLLIRDGCQALTVFGRVRCKGGRAVSAGVERGPRGVKLRVEGREAVSVAELAVLLPVQVVAPDSHRIVEGGPEERRRFLDWGVFHVEHDFLFAWRRNRRALKQRNALIRAGVAQGREQWERELVATGCEIERLRRAYVQRLQTRFKALAKSLLCEFGVDLEYRRGWPEKMTLAQALADGWEADRAAGFTRAGVHRADLFLRAEGICARGRISRGQAKLLVLALQLAQTQLMCDVEGSRPVVLLDDLTSELDSKGLARVLGVVRETGGQVFLSTVDARQLSLSDWLDVRMFHVEQGHLRVAD